MTDRLDRLDRLRSLYERASELGASERAEFLRRECGDDPELSRELVELLEAEGGQDRFLEPPVPVGAVSLPAYRPGVSIGGFRLIERIGRGGMGEVWEAEQGSLERRVALKLLPPDRDFGKAASFFAREARAAGRLSHPGIVSIHGSGTDDGVHWISMELVEGGRTLANLVEEAREQGELTDAHYREVAELTVKLADALQSAHEAGVIHRDLKPMNVLIDHRGDPRVVDFGLARVVTENSLSQTGEFAGSYYYMSPEQVLARRMGIDTRTDVFSLGVVMYELLTLQRPFEGDTPHQIAEKIVMIDPPDPRQLRSRVPRDLAVICAKAMEKRPVDRYVSMSALAADLRRSLAHESITARPPSPARRAMKWSRRHPAASAAGATAVVAFAAISGLLVVNVNTNWKLERSQLELMEESARLELTNVELSEQTEQARMSAASASLQADRRQAVSEFLTWDLFESVAPSSEEGRGRQVTVREVLDAASEKIGMRFERQPLVEATIRDTLGLVYKDLGEFEEAELHLQRALALRREVLGSAHEETHVSTNNLGVLFYSIGLFEDAEPLFEESLAFCRREFGDDDATTLAAVHNLSGILHSLGRVEDAEELMREAVEGRRRVLGPEDPATLLSVNNLGFMLLNSGRPEEAEGFLVDVVETCRRVLGSGDPQTLDSIGNLGLLRCVQGRHEEAVPLWEESLAGRREVLGDPHPDTLISINSLASLYAQLGRHAEAEALARELLALADADDPRFQLFEGFLQSVLRAAQDGGADSEEP